MRHLRSDPGDPGPLDLRDPEAFAGCYRRLAPSALAAATSILRDHAGAEDVVQDVFTTLWLRPEAYAADRGSLGSFVRLMARSRALDRLRSRAAADAALARAADGARVAPASAESPEEAVIRRETARTVVSQLDRQAPAQRRAVLLHHVVGLSDREVATVTRVPLGTAKSRIRLGVRRASEALAA